MLPVFWTFIRSDDTDTSESLQTASTDCKSLNTIKVLDQGCARTTLSGADFVLTPILDERNAYR